MHVWKRTWKHVKTLPTSLVGGQPVAMNATFVERAPTDVQMALLMQHATPYGVLKNGVIAN